MSFKILIFILFFLSTPVKADECLKWFEKEGVKKGEDCLIECAMIETDMGTFHCPESCGALCKEQITERVVFSLSYFYQRLNPTERALIAKKPKKMLTAYQLAQEAKELCRNLFAENLRNDESDACRHFVWAALLYKTFGREFSYTVLKAHEQEPDQPSEEKDMDLKNNKFGLLAAEKLLQRKKLNKKEILKFFKKKLEENSLAILKKNIKNQSPVVKNTDLLTPDAKRIQGNLKVKSQKLENEPIMNKTIREKEEK